mmetsp:Transcript_36347/g.81938  ORF Transcript_36347/g.81938 Transcript_36347/m.81938 type:complete len:269 (+) Transcript_36347:1556-2362(+)
MGLYSRYSRSRVQAGRFLSDACLDGVNGHAVGQQPLQVARRSLVLLQNPPVAPGVSHLDRECAQSSCPAGLQCAAKGSCVGDAHRARSHAQAVWGSRDDLAIEEDLQLEVPGGCHSVVRPHQTAAVVLHCELREVGLPDDRGGLAGDSVEEVDEHGLDGEVEEDLRTLVAVHGRGSLPELPVLLCSMLCRPESVAVGITEKQVQRRGRSGNHRLQVGICDAAVVHPDCRRVHWPRLHHGAVRAPMHQIALVVGDGDLIQASGGVEVGG